MDTPLGRRERKIYSDANPVDKNLSIDHFFDCLRTSRRWAPKALAFDVDGIFVGTDEEERVTILVVPTTIRTIYDYYPSGHARREEHQVPEYEFEGWLLGDYPRKIWVVGALLGQGVKIDLVSLCQLELGEEFGTAFNPLIAQ